MAVRPLTEQEKLAAPNAQREPRDPAKTTYAPASGDATYRDQTSKEAADDADHRPA
jgi:hypothetical protein